VKRRNYGSNENDSVTTIPLTVDAGILAGTFTAPSGHLDATLLRTRAALHVGVTVGAPGEDIPSEGWWLQAQVVLMAFWHPSTVTTPDAISGTAVGFLGSTLLQKRFVASASVPSEYSVQFFTDDDLVTETSRKANSVTTVPCVNWVLSVHDPSFTLQNGYAATNVSYYLRKFALWGSPT
jgi:hypothetical protein